MRFNGSEKQNKWAEKIISSAKLNEKQVDNLLRFAGPTMHEKGIMDVTIVIENRWNLSAYADSLGRFYNLSSEEKHNVAENAANLLKDRR
jgi:hypothetical protein